jgi:Uncharacterised nucleotidyltransferase
MAKSLVLQLLSDSISTEELTIEDWNTILNQARAAQICYRLYLYFEEKECLANIPEKVLLHLKNERFAIQHLHTQVKSEVVIINNALSKLELSPIYLKGAAYLLADLPVSASRLFSDIDILLPQEDIPKAELALKCLGWISQKTDDYDQQYYREYMHEIPPIQHITRGTVLDIHHNILPVCGDHTVNIKRLISDGFDSKNQQTLSSPAIFLHCAVHLFHEGEFEKGLRDLTDLQIMYRDFSKNEAFDTQLVTLAKDTHLARSLYYALHYLQLILSTPLNNSSIEFIEQYKKNLKLTKVRDFMFKGVLLPHHKSCLTWKNSISMFLAYCRSHLIRMPLPLLIPHLIKKLFSRFSKGNTVITKERPNL